MDRGVTQSDLREAFQQQAADLLGPLDPQVKARLRAQALELGHALRQEAMGEALGAGQPHGHVALLAAMADLGGDALGLQRGGAGVAASWRPASLSAMPRA